MMVIGETELSGENYNEIASGYLNNRNFTFDLSKQRFFARRHTNTNTSRQTAIKRIHIVQENQNLLGSLLDWGSS